MPVGLIRLMIVFGSMVLLTASCSGPNGGLFGSRIPHEKYADQLNKSGLQKTALGQLWLQAANKGLMQPLSIQLPYKETGYFDAGIPDAAGYRFTARRGDNLVIELNQKPASGVTLFLDLWQPVENGAPTVLAAPDSALAGLQYEVKKDGVYILRLQPELLAGIEYSLTIGTAPSLNFPVATAANPRIGSFWGDARDAGARKHEGIDIFGAFRTPVVAAADGLITSVTENKLGGKVVFMRPRDKDYVLYYAHLDSQMVREGQRVQSGDTLGLMGNTGNARTTPPHLHFGIYAIGGAIDPFPFVNRIRSAAPAINASLQNLNELVRSEKRTRLVVSNDHTVPLDEATLLQVKAATNSSYKVKLPDETEGFIAAADVRIANAALRQYAVVTGSPVFDKPDTTAAVKTIMNKGEKWPVLGKFKDYYFVKNDSLSGWISK
jgi:murein DD-endopeptidase MepM/ murein hydrolase activator NlpD